MANQLILNYRALKHTRKSWGYVGVLLILLQHVWVGEKDVKLAIFNGFQQKLIIKCDLIFNLQKKTSLKPQGLFVIAPHMKNTHLLHQKELSEDLS